MSNAVWERRRLRQRLLRALKTLRRDPEATVPITRGLVAISMERDQQLRAALKLIK